MSSHCNTPQDTPFLVLALYVTNLEEIVEALRARTRTTGRARREYQQRLRCARGARRGRGVPRGGRPDEVRVALLGAVRAMRVDAEELLREMYAEPPYLGAER